MGNRQVSTETVKNILSKFNISGNVCTIKAINSGYINTTYKVETISNSGHIHKYILQRINENVFHDIDGLMSNYLTVTTYLADFKLPGTKSNQHSVPILKLTKDGKKPYCKTEYGCWRVTKYIGSVVSFDIPDSPQTFFYAGQAFGSFVKALSGIDPNKISVILPDFHNTLSRYNDLQKAIALDPFDRVKDLSVEITSVESRREFYPLISNALESGEIPTRICHNDCNLNNILFDKKTRLPVAIIDLDTVMPSSPLYDYGDSMRVGTNTAKDDEKDLSKVSCDLTLYEKYADGYLSVYGSAFTEKELELLPYASIIITSEDSIRFLMDHINGDTYYIVSYPGQNLDRARTQLKLASDMQTKLPQIKDILNKLYRKYGLNKTL